MLTVVASGLIILISFLISYRNSRDAICPIVIFTPLLTYIYVYLPSQMIAGEHWDRFPELKQDVDFVGWVNLTSIAAFCLTATPFRSLKPAMQTRLMQPLTLEKRIRERLFASATFLSVLGVAGFLILIANSGGFGRVFRHGKPFFSSGSGYLGELPNLSFPAMIMYAFAWQGQQITPIRILILLIAGSPHLIMASLGGRRGAAFLVIVTLAGCIALIRGRAPRWSTVVSGLTVIGILMLFLLTQRKNIHLGSEFEFSLQDTVDALLVREVSEGHEAVVAAAGITAARKLDRYYWGTRYAVVLFVRPIPRQLWPNKYEDVGMSWVVTAPGSSGFTNYEWIRTVGFIPFKGNAGGFVTDMFIEFWWFGAAVIGLIGASYKYVWQKARNEGGFWPLFYFLMISLSVYLPSQSVQAWLVRLLILSVPAFVVWRVMIRKGKPLPMKARYTQ